jgi:CRISPR system Cascade subunit CasE
MTSLHLLRLRVQVPTLTQFAAEQGLLTEPDDGFGYVMHAWLAALFGKNAPKPFRYFESKSELLGYSFMDGPDLLSIAQTFASPLSWSALSPNSLVTKPMPTEWRPDLRIQIEVLACPISRKDGHEKDVYLRAVDNLGADAPRREEVYLEWFRHQCAGAVQFEHLELAGVGRSQLLRRSRSVDGGRRLLNIERPHAHFRAIVRIVDSEAFAALLARGVGRHRAFGFGMPLIAPAP